MRQQTATQVALVRRCDIEAQRGGEFTQQGRYGRRARVVGDADIRDAAGEAPGGAQRRFERQPTLADPRRTMEVSLSSPLLLWIISHPRRPHEGVRMDDQSGSLHEGIHR
jgi:hypothetical protein